MDTVFDALAEPWGYDKNIEYNPESCGLEIIGKLEDVKACYSFDTILVVRSLETKKVYAAHDTGCSCPIPFEDVHSLGDMVEINNLTELKRLIGENDSDYDIKWPFEDRFALYNKVSAALRELRVACT